MRKYARASEVAAALGLTERQIRRLCASGVLPSVKLKKSVRIPLDRLEVILERNERDRKKAGGNHGA